MQNWIFRVSYRKPRLFQSYESYNISRIMNTKQVFVLQVLSAIHSQKVPPKSKDHEYEIINKKNEFITPRTEKKIGQRYFLYLPSKIYSVVRKNPKTSKKRKMGWNKSKNWMNGKVQYFNAILNPQ